MVCLLLGSFAAFAQVHTSGRIVDENGEPLAGASVVELGTRNGSISDLDGTFHLTVKPKAVLQVAFFGFKTVEVPAARRMEIVMEEDRLTLDDVVVIGYGQQKKSSLTGAISSVKSDDFENRTVVNAQEALQGKIAGLNLVTTDAAPGSTSTIRIRGISSNASTDPLYVVDGMRMSNIDDLDPNVIESMEVLKDAASAAIYGAEAGNGVILITTKKGSRGNVRISYDFQYASQSLGHMPQLLNAKEYVEYMLESEAYTQYDIDNNWNGKTDTDWIGEAFENSSLQKHTLSLSGGNDRGKFFLSLGYSANDGIAVGNKDYYNRYTGAINAEYKLKPWLTAGTTNNLSYSKTSVISATGGTGTILADAFNADPLTKPFYAQNEFTAHMQELYDLGYNLPRTADGLYYGCPMVTYCMNPLERIEMENDYSSGTSLKGTVYGNLNLFKGFVFTSRFGYSIESKHSTSYETPYYASADFNNPYFKMSSENRSSVGYQWENFANYSREFGSHTVNAMVGMSVEERSTDNVKGSLDPNGEDAVTVNDPKFYYLDYASASANKSVGGDNSRSAKLSYFGRIGYEFRNKYMLQATLRADAADLSKLPLQTRWGYFPSVSGAWVISQEPFFSPLKEAVDFMKFRLSWGQNGSLASLSGYKYSTDIKTSGYYPLDPDNLSGVIAAYPATMGNNELRWETSEQFDAGLDMHFFDGRLAFDADYFIKKTRDLLVSDTTPSLEVGGATSPINAGNVLNKGFELELAWKSSVGKDFTYGIRGNLATLSNLVTYVDPSLERIEGSSWAKGTVVTYFEEGYPIYYMRGWRFSHIDEATGDPLFFTADNELTPSPTDSDKTMIGNGMPDLTYGVTLNAAYKGFDLTVFCNGTQGNDIFMAYTRYSNLTSNRVKSVWYDDRWTSGNTAASHPRAGANNLDKYTNSDAMVFDGSYFKVKQIQLGYSIPRKLLQAIHMNRARIYTSFEDFFTFTSYPGFDPAVASSSAKSGMGMDQGAYPASKKIVFGINVEF